jgi:tetratricopeptide (TPR) repeat protein
LNPTLDQAHYYRAVAFYHLGLLEQAEQDVRAGLEVNPGNRSDAARTRGRLALYRGRFEESAGLLEELKRVTRGTTYDGDLAFAYYYRGEHERAEQLLAPLRGGSIPDRRAQAQLASFLGADGRRAEAETLLRAIIQGGYTDHHVAYNVGTAYAGLGNFTEARRWLRQAAETGLPNYPWFESDPLLAPIRKDAEFQAFLSELKKSFEATQQRYARGSR